MMEKWKNRILFIERHMIFERVISRMNTNLYKNSRILYKRIFERVISRMKTNLYTNSRILIHEYRGYYVGYG